MLAKNVYGSDYEMTEVSTLARIYGLFWPNFLFSS